MNKLGVVVFVDGGNVTAVYACNPKLAVKVVDFDNLKAEKGATSEDCQNIFENAIRGKTEVY